MNDAQQSLPWLTAYEKQLKHYIIQNRIPQALLVMGGKGLGKHRLVNSFAQSLLCMQRTEAAEYCGHCRSCILFSAQTHPDYLYLAPEETGKVIGIDVIRQLTAKLALKPQFDGHRVVVINPAEALNNASANAFLKYLEEPSERTSLLLISNAPAKLLATIKSRCQQLLIDTPNSMALKEWLQQQGIVNESSLLLNLAQGAPLLAKQFAEDGIVVQRNTCFKQWEALAKSENKLIEISEQWSKLDKAKIDLLLFWLISWVMDMIKLSYQQQITIINSDLVLNLQELVSKLNLIDLYKYYDGLLLSHNRFDTQLNKQLMFEEMLIQWTQLNKGMK